VDTQVLVWLMNDPRLGKETTRMLLDMSNNVSISYLSLFELTIKASIGKLTWDTSVIEDLPRMGIELVMPAVKALRGYTIFNPASKDPFDNMIISVAHSKNSALVTSNPKILAASASSLKVIDATK
jgi:PIN domain nuclease of toxin-antitoxin system